MQLSLDEMEKHTEIFYRDVCPLLVMGLVDYQHPTKDHPRDCVVNLTDKGFEFLISRLQSVHKANPRIALQTVSQEDDSLFCLRNRRSARFLEVYLMKQKQIDLLVMLLQNYLLYSTEYDRNPGQFPLI